MGQRDLCRFLFPCSDRKRNLSRCGPPYGVPLGGNKLYPLSGTPTRRVRPTGPHGRKPSFLPRPAIYPWQQRSIFFFERACLSPVPRNETRWQVCIPLHGAERIFSPPFVLSFGNQCSVLFMERSQKLCATFWGFPVTNSSVLSLLKGKNISVPSAAVLLLDLRGHPPITYSEKRQICAPYYNLDTIPPSILSFSLFSCTLYKARKKGSNHLQIKSISSASRQIRPYPHKEMFAHPPLVRTSEWGRSFYEKPIGNYKGW